MKDNPASRFVKVKLRVPRGLWNLPEPMQSMTNEAPKEYLERSLRMELGYILNYLQDDMFDLKHMDVIYGKASDTSGVAF
jgi:hypothetical protein